MRKVIKNYAVYLFLSLSAISCAPKTPQNLADYPAVTTIFTEQETADLQTLIHSFEQEIGIRADASPEAKAEGYAVFNTQLVALLNGQTSAFPLTDDMRNRLFDGLHVGTFRSIWNVGVARNHTGETRPDIGIHTLGKFVGFLGELGKEYPPFAEVRDNIVRAGDISPAVAMIIFKDFENIRIQDPRVRLV